MNMTQAEKAFSFKKNTDIEALPHAVPQETTPAKPTQKAGRKPRLKNTKTDKQVSAYLSQDEWKAFEQKLDGRTTSKVMRNLILEHIKNG